MKQRIYTLLFALLTIVTGAKAATTTIELYDGLKWTAEIESVVEKLVIAHYLDEPQNGKSGVIFSKDGKRLFGVEKDKLGNYTTINVWTTVIPSEDYIRAIISGDRIALNFSVVISEKFFPDANFLAYVKGFDTDTRTLNRLTRTELEAVSEMELRDKGITSLKGIEYFAKLKKLVCRENLNLTTLDASKNTALEELACYNNGLTSLKVSPNCTSLRTLRCHGNYIGETEMGNLVESLPTVTNGSFYVMDLSFENNVINKLQVQAAKAKGWKAYALVNYSSWTEYEGTDPAPIAIDETNFPDATFRAYVKNNFDKDKDGYLSFEETTAVTEINVRSSGITDIKGVEYFTELTILDFGWNKLTAVDISKNTKLTKIHFNSNQLKKLDVSKNTALVELRCEYNELTELNVSNCTELYYFVCKNNQLTKLDVSNKAKLWCLECDYNQLTEIILSGSTLGTFHCEYNKLASLDLSDSVIRGISCNNNLLTEIDVSGQPELEYLNSDDNQLKVLDLSKNPKLYSLYCNNNELTALDLSKNSELKTLFCSDNPLSELDVSGCMALEYVSCKGCQLTTLDLSMRKKLSNLFCYENKLTELNVSGCTAIESLYCYDNQLTTLDASGCLALKWLSCNNNQLTAINLSGCTALYYLYCPNNLLTSLDLSDYSELQTLYCNRNKLTTLDVSGCASLYNLYCNNNQLKMLDVSGCSKLQFFYCHQNQVRGAGMATLVSSLPGDRSGAYIYVYDAHESPEGNMMTKTQLKTASEKGWNVQQFDRIDEATNIYWVDYLGEAVRGDANGDGELTAADVETIRDYILGQLPDDQPIDEESADLNGDGEINIEDLTLLIDLITTPIGQACPDDHHPHLIDLGLPSGTLWACCNVGADKPEAYGGYYAWGETKAKDSYDWSTYIYCEGTVETCQDIGTDIAGTKYDAAYVNWGGNWATPSYEQFQELKSNTTSEWTTQNGVNGRLFTASNGATLFLSASGGYWPGSLDSKDRFGYYWSSSSFEDDDRFPHFAKVFYFGEDGVWDSAFSYMLGLPVRPVRK